jgi:uncharacterized protein YecT (DUF1311 family)
MRVVTFAAALGCLLISNDSFAQTPADCSRQADTLGLQGAERLLFREKCKLGAPPVTSSAPMPPAAPTAQRPSFDCTKAKSASARLICSDAELAKLDAQLGVAFQKRKAQTSQADQQKVTADEVAWIRERNKQCNLVGNDSAPADILGPAKDCMAIAIKDRIKFLDAPPTNEVSASSSQNNQIDSSPKQSPQNPTKFFPPSDQDEDERSSLVSSLIFTPIQPPATDKDLVNSCMHAASRDARVTAMGTQDFKRFSYVVLEAIDTKDTSALCVYDKSSPSIALAGFVHEPIFRGHILLCRGYLQPLASSLDARSFATLCFPAKEKSDFKALTTQINCGRIWNGEGDKIGETFTLTLGGQQAPGIPIIEVKTTLNPDDRHYFVSEYKTFAILNFFKKVAVEYCTKAMQTGQVRLSAIPDTFIISITAPSGLLTEAFEGQESMGQHKHYDNWVLRKNDLAFSWVQERLQQAQAEDARRQAAEAQRLADLEKQRAAAARQQARGAFISQYHVEAWTRENDFSANPFVFQGKVVALETKFRRMISPSDAAFSWDGVTPIIIGSVPATLFTHEQSAVIAVKVDGTRTLKLGAETTVPNISFVGVYQCGDDRCSSFFDPQ